MLISEESKQIYLNHRNVSTNTPPEENLHMFHHQRKVAACLSTKESTHTTTTEMMAHVSSARPQQQKSNKNSMKTRKLANRKVIICSTTRGKKAHIPTIQGSLKLAKINSIPAQRRRGHLLTACNATPPAKSKMAARGPQNGRRGLQRCLPLGFWAF